MIKRESKSNLEIIPSFLGSEIIKRPEFTKQIQNIKNLVSCPEQLYKKLYLIPLFCISEYCQSMPYAENEFNKSFGFLERQLNLAIAALKLRRGTLLPKNAGAEAIAAEEAQWTYAIFSASLLKNLPQLQNGREVMLYQIHGDCIGEWSPIAGSIYKDSFYYHMTFSIKPNIPNTDVFMAALSGHIIPQSAVAWLATNKSLFAQWWDAILHKSTLNNDIETIIQLAANKVGITLCSH